MEGLEPGDGKPLLDRPANPLCTQCGLCCVMLSAAVTEEEADVISEENGLAKEKFCHVEQKGEGPNAGRLVLNMPCRFLLGRPTSHTACRIYGDDKTRPSVCETYLCRVAMQYKTGVLELEPARKILRDAFVSGKASLFNWIGLTGEKELQSSAVIGPLRQEASRMVEEYGDEGKLGVLDEREVGDILIAKNVTPVYAIHSDLAHLELNLLLNFYDRGDHELKDVIPQRVLDQLGERDKEVAMMVYSGILGRLRSLFMTVPEMQGRQIADEVVDQVEKEGEEDDELVQQEA